MQNKISNVQILSIRPKDGLVGFASFVLDDNFYVGSVGIYTRAQGGYRLTYPTRKISNENIPIFHPINKEIAHLLEQAVISKFQEVYDRQ